MMNYIKSSLDRIWITQKYIESPLIIQQKKFDIRQWVCVTSWKPKLQIWFYQENYLRFTSENYDPNQLHNKFANLTNATVNKENLENVDRSEGGDKAFLKIEGNMYTNFQFEAWLNKEYTNYTDDRYPNGPY